MLKIQNLNISYQRKILENVEFVAKCGEVTLICGESGSGKTALLYRLALLVKQKDYQYSLDNHLISLSNQQLKAHLRRYHISYVLQDSMLIDYYNVKENINHYAQMVQKQFSDQDIQNLFHQVHLNVPLDQSIDTLSGGERQRLAIACALAKDSEVIILDEPTSYLDSQNEEKILMLIRQLAKEQKKCIILASHSLKAKEYADSIYQIQNLHLNCVHHSLNQDHKQLILHKSQSNLKFLNSYVKRYFHVFKKKQRNMILIMATSFIMIFSVITGIHYYQKTSTNHLLALSDNQVYITSQSNGQHIQATNQIMDNQILDSISADKVYPYIYSKMTLWNQTIDVLPYFEENKITDKLEYQYHLLDKEAIILSYDVYQLMKRNYLSTNYFDGEIDIRIENENNPYWITKTMNQNIKGVLNEGEINHYTTNKYCIYVPYEILMRIYQEQTNDNKFIGYTLFSKNLETHLKLVEKLNQMDQLAINDDFQNTTVLNEINAHTEKMKQLFIPIIIIGTIYITVMMSLRHFQSRQKEFVLSLINGLSNKDIMKIVIIETFYQILIAIFLFIIVSIIIICLFSIDKNIIYQNIIWLIVEIGLLMICIFIINGIQIRNLSIEDVLRNE